MPKLHKVMANVDTTKQQNKPMKIYISIPITNHDLVTQRAKAAEIAEKIKALGHEPVNPLDTPEPQGKLSDKERYAYFMGEDIKRLMLCDAAIFCEGWSKSVGCTIECDVAQRMGLQLFFSIAMLERATVSSRQKWGRNTS